MSTFALKKCNGGHKQNLEKKTADTKMTDLINFDALLTQIAPETLQNQLPQYRKNR